MSCKNNTERDVMLTPVPAVSPSPIVSATPKQQLQAKQIEKTWETQFEFVTKTIKRTHRGSRGYEISADYPQIRQQSYRTAKFNRWIRSKVTGYVHRFERLERRAEAYDRRKKLKPAGIDEGLEIWFKVYYGDDRLISLRLTHSVMALGQMHPIDYYETINYDLQRGKPLQSYEIFKESYLKAFSRFSRKFIPEHYEMTGTTDEWLKVGTEAKRSNFPNWNIVPEGILIAFEDYQIGSHSFGQLELIIPYSELRSVLKPNAFTARFDGISKNFGNRQRKLRSTRREKPKVDRRGF